MGSDSARECLSPHKSASVDRWLPLRCYGLGGCAKGRGLVDASAFLGTNSRIHLKLAIIRTLSDGRDVTQLGPEVFSGTSISQGAQYLGDGHGQFALSGGPRIAQRGGPVEPVLLLDKEDFDDSNTK